MDKLFYGKVLLLGEYTVIDGGMALAVPFPKVHGYLTQGEEREINKDLLKFHDYLSEIPECKLDLNRFLDDINEGLAYKSNAPKGYGVGSSGILTAAVFDRYHLHNRVILSDLRKMLGIMESFFHGKSSGTDPLVSFLNHPMIIDSSIELQGEIDKKFYGNWFLFDSGMPRSTQKLVRTFQDRKDGMVSQLSSLKSITQEAIRETISGVLSIKDLIQKISTLQMQNFDFAIPSHIKPLWSEGLETGEYFFKLCGAGGGGYFLVYCESSETLKIPLIPIR